MMQSQNNIHIRDIIISGGGPAGMMAALALTDQGHRVTLIGPATDHDDRRTTALMMPAIDFLRSIQTWDSIEPTATALKSMRIIDGTSRLIRNPTVTFHASEIDEHAFGYNIPNAALNKKLSDQVSSIAHIERIYDTVETYTPHSDMVEMQHAMPQILKLNVGAILKPPLFFASRMSARITLHPLNFTPKMGHLPKFPCRATVPVSSG